MVVLACVLNSAAGLAEDGVVCDRFQIRWALEGRDLLLSIDTDLPDYAKITVTVSRLYHELGTANAYGRDYFGVRSDPVSRWREPRRIKLDDQAWSDDLEAHQARMAKLGADFAFRIDRIEDDIKIRAVLPVRQDHSAFGGRGNPGLSGAATTTRSDIGVFVEAERRVPFPMDAGRLVPESSTTVGGLEVVELAGALIVAANRQKEPTQGLADAVVKDQGIERVNEVGLAMCATAARNFEESGGVARRLGWPDGETGEALEAASLAATAVIATMLKQGPLSTELTVNQIRRCAKLDRLAQGLENINRVVSRNPAIARLAANLKGYEPLKSSIMLARQAQETAMKTIREVGVETR